MIALHLWTRAQSPVAERQGCDEESQWDGVREAVRENWTRLFLPLSQSFRVRFHIIDHRFRISALNFTLNADVEKQSWILLKKTMTDQEGTERKPFPVSNFNRDNSKCAKFSGETYGQSAAWKSLRYETWCFVYSLLI